MDQISCLHLTTHIPVCLPKHELRDKTNTHVHIQKNYLKGVFDSWLFSSYFSVDTAILLTELLLATIIV